MPRWTGTTTERGYGYAHQAERARRLALYRPGDRCAHGGEPLNYPSQIAARYLDLPHTADRTGYLPGLSCKKHNRIDGAIRGNQAAGFRAASAGSNVHCKTCGKPYHYAARTCIICGAHYHPTHRRQRTCGRACGMELKRRNRVTRADHPGTVKPGDR